MPALSNDFATAVAQLLVHNEYLDFDIFINVLIIFVSSSFDVNIIYASL